MHFILRNVILLSAITIGAHCLSAFPTTFLEQSDIIRIKNAIKLSSPLPSNSLANIYYSLLSQTLLSQTIDDANSICTHLQSQMNEELENIYFITSAAKLVSNCQISPAHFVTKLDTFLREDASVQDIYRATHALLNYGRTLDSTKVSKVLTSALKRDESLLNNGLAFQLVAKLSKAEDRNYFVDKIGDVIVQSDEVDGRFLQFEGGLGISSAIILGVYQLSSVSNKPIGLSNDQALKFANYFLSRKHVLTPKGISELLSVLNMYTNNKFHIPVVITNYGSSALSLTNPIMTVRVTNVLGKTLGSLTVTCESATRVEDNKAIWTKKNFQAVEGDSTLYSINFLDSKPPRGFYDLTFTTTPTKPDTRLIGNTGVVLKATVLTQITIINAEIIVADRDSGGSASVNKLEYPSSLSTQLEADYHQKLVIKFQLRDTFASNLLGAHQTFVQLLNVKTKQEIVFIAESDSALTYKMDLNLMTKSKELNYISGEYEITLIVGDAVVSNPIEWKIATINLQLASSPVQTASQMPVSPFVAKPQIIHSFKEPEKRPPPFISNAFSFLILIPVLILFALWIKIGINLSAFPFTVSALVFHIGLALIFLLYVCFFVKLNMFQTCKYLAIIGVITFLAGHSLLSRLARTKN